MEKTEDLKRFKILYLPRWYPSKIDPMPGLFIERHAIVASHFAEVTVLAIIPSKDVSEIEIKKKDHFLTLCYYFKQGRTGSLLIDKIINQYRWMFSLLNGYRIVRREMKGFDILHVNVLTRLGLFALFISIVENTPYVITEHWTRYVNGGFKGKLRILATRLVVRKAKVVSTVTDNLWKAMQSYNISNPQHFVLQNVVDDSFFKPQPSIRQTLTSSTNRFVHVSCFTDKSKNISGLLRVLSRINKVTSNFECLLVGEGEDMEMLKEYAKGLGLKSPQVQFKGLAVDDALVQIMRSSSFLVLFSNYENMPVVINEAFSCGLPVLATYTGGIHEQVKDWNGRLVQPQDEDALYSEILSLLEHHTEYDHDRIKKYAEQWFSSEAIEKQLKQLYGL